MGLLEILIIVIVLLLFFGPNKPKAIFKSFGDAIRGFKNGLNDREVEYRNITDSKDENKDS